MEEFEVGLEELIRFVVPWEEWQLVSQGLNHQPRGTHGSSPKCGGGMPCRASVGGEGLVPMKA